MVCQGLDIAHWDLVKDEIAKALDEAGGRVSADDIYERIQDKRIQLWALHNDQIKAVMTTEIINYPQMRCVCIYTVTGENMHEWLDTLIQTINDWGAGLGCHAIEFCGRKGWEKVLEPKGFGQTNVFMTRPIQ